MIIQALRSNQLQHQYLKRKKKISGIFQNPSHRRKIYPMIITQMNHEATVPVYIQENKLK